MDHLIVSPLSFREFLSSNYSETYYNVKREVFTKHPQILVSYKTLLCLLSETFISWYDFKQ
jgi:hypothetical protein